MSIKQRSIGVLLVLALLCVGAAVVTIRAAEQKSGAAGTQATSASTGAQPAPAAKGAQDAGAKSNSAGQASTASPSGNASGAQAPAKGGHQSASAPQVPEEGAIKDDPTVAPDPQESADNNVSFPADI